MSFIVVDVEADGSYPGGFSMVSFGAVVVRGNLDEYFYGKVKPISTEWNPEALAVSNISREEHMSYADPKLVMLDFVKWVEKVSDGRPVFVSDNPCFDWMFMCYYLHKYAGKNPFGFSGRRIGDIYCGLVKDAYANSQWKRLRKTKHTHHPVDDAKGNAEALMHFKDKMGLKIDFK